MQVLYFGNGEFKIKSNTGTIFTGEKLKINDFSIEGPGEYEVAGITAENIHGITIFHAEDIDIAYLNKRKEVLNDQETELISGMDILLIPVGGGEVFEPKEALEVINQVEPKLVIPMYYQDISGFLKLEGIESQQLDYLKVNKTNLPEDKRQIIILNVQSK